MITYFITGLTGFLGTNLLLELEKSKDIRIVTLVLPSEMDSDCLKHPFVKTITGSILNKNDVMNFLSEKCDGDKIVIHAAGKISTFKRNDKSTMQINYDGTKNIVDSMNQIGDFKKLVYISSVDSMPLLPKDQEINEVGYYDINKVNGIYGKSKALSNNYILDNLKTESILLLPSAIMGPNDPKLSPINNAIKKFLINKLPAITKGGYNIVDVRDVAKAIVASCSITSDKQSYLISGEYITVKDLIDKAAEISNKKTIKKKVPHILIKLISPFIEIHSRLHRKIPLFTGFSMDCLMQNSNYSYKKAHSAFGYEPRPIRETISDTISWMKESNYLSK